MTLYQQWLDAKATEQEAIAKRREIEDFRIAAETQCFKDLM